MLKLKNICKYYNVGKKREIILDNVTLDFKDHELVFILGESGSGKSTLLNIIAGNLKSDAGEIWLYDTCISSLSESKLNGYRKSVIGNIFQDYNLIEYMNVYDNVSLKCTNGTSKNKIMTLLNKLGIVEKRNTKVSKLSGGQKQRVAIARALVNEPSIILADEPTGALDSTNSIDVMDILKDISKSKLVVVVSHDEYLAKRYADRIINIKDGKCSYYPVPVLESNNNIDIKKNRIKFISIIKLAIKNLMLKHARTFITSLAISLGFVSMFLVANLYNNFDTAMIDLEEKIVSIFPIIVRNGEFENASDETVKATDKIVIKDRDKWIHNNRINDKYVTYLKNISEIKYLTYGYDISFPLISDTYKLVDKNYMMMLPSSDYIDSNFDIIYGRNISDKHEVLIKVDINNNGDSRLFDYFGINEDITYDEIVGRRIKVVTNDLYYVRNGGYFVINNVNNKELYENSIIELSIVGVIREKEETDNNNYIYYDGDLISEIIEENKNSEVVKSQINVDYNILGSNVLKNDMLSYLGYNSVPNEIMIYTDNVDDRKTVINKLDEYNLYNEKLIYVDTMTSSIEIVRKFIVIISLILAFFSIIGIVISSLMVGIITSVRVLENKKEIGILRSLGYSRNNIKMIFNIENIIIGIMASGISFLIIKIMANPINEIIDKYLDLSNLFVIKYGLMLMVFMINMLIINMFGRIPAKKASKMEIVNCIYNR